MDNWTKDAAFLCLVNPSFRNPDLLVRDLWVDGSKEWNVNMVTDIMSAADAQPVLNTPLSDAIRDERNILSSLSLLVLCEPAFGARPS